MHLKTKISSVHRVRIISLLLCAILGADFASAPLEASPSNSLVGKLIQACAQRLRALTQRSPSVPSAVTIGRDTPQPATAGGKRETEAKTEREVVASFRKAIPSLIDQRLKTLVTAETLGLPADQATSEKLEAVRDSLRLALLGDSADKPGIYENYIFKIGATIDHTPARSALGFTVKRANEIYHTLLDAVHPSDAIAADPQVEQLKFPKNPKFFETLRPGGHSRSQPMQITSFAHLFHAKTITSQKKSADRAFINRDQIIRGHLNAIASGANDFASTTPQPLRLHALMMSIILDAAMIQHNYEATEANRQLLYPTQPAAMTDPAPE